MVYNRDTVIKELREYVAEVHFKKVNGEDRILRCTLKPEHLPEKYITEQAIEREYHETNKDVVRAWDMINGGWRSFRIDSVTYMQIIDAY